MATCCLSPGAPALPHSPSPPLPHSSLCPAPREMKVGGTFSTITSTPGRSLGAHVWKVGHSLMASQGRARQRPFPPQAGSPTAHSVSNPEGASCPPLIGVPTTSQCGGCNPLGASISRGMGKWSVWEEEIKFPAPSWGPAFPRSWQKVSIS